MTNKEFISEIFEIAFGADAFPYEGYNLVERGFSRQECIDEIRKLSDNTLENERLRRSIYE